MKFTSVYKPTIKKKSNLSKVLPGIFVALSLGAVIFIGTQSLKDTAPEQSSASIVDSNLTIEFGKIEQLPDSGDLPDAPARAYIDKDGFVRLFSSHTRTFLYKGDNLNDLSVTNQIIYTSQGDSNARNYSDSEWLYSPYTSDGETIYSLVHNEYHGWEHNNCASGELNCWWNAITLAKSIDKGDNFVKVAQPPNHVIMAPIPDYNPLNELGPIGHMEATNILENDGYYYSLVSQLLPMEESSSGKCLVRTNDLSKPDGWEYFDTNTGVFSIIPDDGRIKCTVLNGPGGYSWNYSDYLEKYISYSAHWEWGGSFALSSDMKTWTNSSSWFDKSRACIYASFIDPGSNSRNFETIGRSPWLYFTTCSNGCVPGCGGQNRILSRVRVRISKPEDIEKYELLDLQFNERRGDLALDASYYGNDATVTNGNFQTEQDTNFVSLSGNAYISVNHADELNIEDSFTIKTKIRKNFDAEQTQYTAILTKETNSCESRNYGFFIAPSGKLHFSYSKDDGVCEGYFGETIVADGQWHEISLHVDSANKKIYYVVDNVLDKTVSYTYDIGQPQSINDSNVVIGGGDIDIDYITLFNYILPIPEDTCSQNCLGKACGEDGCVGSCGTCAEGKTCNANGLCVDLVSPNVTQSITGTLSPTLNVSPTAIPKIRKADYTGTGRVGMADFAKFKRCYVDKDVCSDLNEDGNYDRDINDWLVFIREYKEDNMEHRA